MTNKEILAELKKSYEYLFDIIENGSQLHCDGQMDIKLINQLEQAKDNIANIYARFYETLDDEELRVRIASNDFPDGCDYYIGDTVDTDYREQYDYETNESYFTTCEDLDYYWYEDKDFIYDKEEK